MKQTRIGRLETSTRVDPERPLGSRALWGRVGYNGDAFAPAPGTYALIDPVDLAYTTVQDSGRYPARGGALANLYPLVAAALYEIGFVMEAGPTTAWTN